MTMKYLNLIINYYNFQVIKFIIFITHVKLTIFIFILVMKL